MTKQLFSCYKVFIDWHFLINNRGFLHEKNTYYWGITQS